VVEMAVVGAEEMAVVGAEVEVLVEMVLLLS
jgi:hypothetical protein